MTFISNVNININVSVKSVYYNSEITGLHKRVTRQLSALCFCDGRFKAMECETFHKINKLLFRVHAVILPRLFIGYLETKLFYRYNNNVGSVG